MIVKVNAKWWAAIACLLLTAQIGYAGTIAGSSHDFTTAAASWGGGQVCIACHTPHNSVSPGSAPLWNHTVTTQSYTLYASSTLQATMVQPTVGDKLCLSCHDGTVALDSFGGKTGTTFVSAVNNLGTNLNVHHPSSFLYDAALATADGALFDPSAKVVTVGTGTQSKTGTVSSVMLSGGLVQCSSCHDVHNTYNATASKLLKITMARSGLCFACHSY